MKIERQRQRQLYEAQNFQQNIRIETDTQTTDMRARASIAMRQFVEEE